MRGSASESVASKGRIIVPAPISFATASSAATLRPDRISFAPRAARPRASAALDLLRGLVGEAGRVEGERVRVDAEVGVVAAGIERSEEHTSELQSLMRISYAVFRLKKKRQ